MAGFCRAVLQKSIQSLRASKLDSGFSILNLQRQFTTCLPFHGEKKYSEKHEYVDIEGSRAKLGITDHAQRELGDVVYIELPSIDAELEKDDVACSVESVKAVAEVYMPISGKVTAVNKDLETTPDLVNSSPEDEGWLVEFDITKPEQTDSLMDREGYEKFLNTTE